MTNSVGVSSEVDAHALKSRPRRSPKVPLIALTIVTVALIALVIVAVQKATTTSNNGGVAVTPAASSVLSIGNRAPLNFHLPKLSGNGTIALTRATAGRPAVINFFASWCAACAAELQAFGTVSHNNAAHVAFVGIDTNDTSPATARAMLATAHASYPVGVDTASLAMGTAYGINDLPVTFFIDAKGTVKGEVLGAQTAASLQRRVAALVAGKAIR
jgi:thiol-disulfide isomerase/thioredoxin